MTHPATGSDRGATRAAECPFCAGPHDWADCNVVYTPIKDCEFKNAEDGCCSHPKNMTPECHVNACPRLNPKLQSAAFPTHSTALRSGVGEALAAWDGWRNAPDSDSKPCNLGDVADAMAKLRSLHNQTKL